MRRFLIACDNPELRIALKWAIQQRFMLLQIDAVNRTEACGLLLQQNYDAVLLDVAAGENALDALKTTLLISPDSKVLLHTDAALHAFAVRCYQAGAWALLQKAAGTDACIRAVQCVLDGQKFFSAAVTASITLSYFETESDNPFSKLSERESEVATQLLKGIKLPQISASLKLQKTTVATYKKRILEKLHARNLTDMMELAQYHRFTEVALS